MSIPCAHTSEPTQPQWLFGPKPLAPELAPLEQYQQLNWLRPLDLAFVRWLHEQGEQNVTVLLVAALLSHQVGRGHTCLDLQQLLEQTNDSLDLPPNGRAYLAPSTPQQWLADQQLETLQQALQQSSQVQVITQDENQQAPLVLDDKRLYLRRYFNYETQVAEALLGRLQQQFTLPNDLPVQLQRLFAPLKDPAEQQGQTIHWQSVAAALAARSGISVISGGPGTGKTTTVVRLLALLQSISLAAEGVDGRGLRIQLAAPTGKAAARLSESLASTLTAITAGQVAEIDAEIGARIPTTVSTLHRLLGARSDTRRFIHNAVNPLNLDVLVVDEASMVDLEMMANLLAAVPAHARLILLGDKDQLASVEAGAVLGDLCDQAEKGHYQADTEGFIFRTTGYSVHAYVGAGHGLEQQTVMLRKSHRFGEHSGIGQLARAINRGDVDGARTVLLNSQGDVAYLKNSDAEFKALVLDGQVPQLQPQHDQQPHGYRHYLSLVQQGVSAFASEIEWQRAVLDAFGQFQVLAALREGEWGVQGLNKRIARLLYQQKLISQEQGWYAGRPVMVQRNDYSLDLMNGDIGICLPVQAPNQSQSLRVIFPMPDGTLKAVQPSRLEEVETVFVMTVHKSQGSEFAHTALVLPDSSSPVLTRELIYTGVTRAKLWFSLLINQPMVVREAIKKRTMRASGLKQRLRALK